MELNREQIITALECCIYEKPCRLCPLNDYSHDADGCKRELMKHALIFIRESTEEKRGGELVWLKIPEGGIGNLSDGYHTFNELYHHRAVLFSVICNSMPNKAWKSKLHDTGEMYDGMFIVGIETPEGNATYHYDIEPYWDMFKVKELERAPKWDGHTPQMAIDRISRLSVEVAKDILEENDG